jgi:hypothetical protein
MEPTLVFLVVLCCYAAATKAEPGGNTMQQIDPTQYRYFIVRGVLCIHGTTLELFQACHADDLPAGEDGKTMLAERVRNHYATEEGDSAASWQEVEVQEFDPPSEMYAVPTGTW